MINTPRRRVVETSIYRFSTTATLIFRIRVEIAGDVNLLKEEKSFKLSYSRAAAETNADLNFLVFRKLSWLHNFVLLCIQDKLEVL